ncbi:phage integrase family protein [Phycisphaera mikurensis NBRC 102666]|uniref:Phage integrase family protein n=1 Tax=Phycisphaera mikurensis (strain NBRC 102666 / KCTC 22515 / FYK2301M01) TaxID=1142394 RepID=I0IF90_PHYMF|nr:phage integrase family protein [Phycisphaera mikurensis NBRC 102666]
MASMTTDPRGNVRVYVRLRDGRRRAVWLGKMAKRRAEQVAAHVGELEAAGAAGLEPTPPTRAWLSRVEGTLRERLVACGLAEPLEAAATATLGELSEAWLKTKAATKKPNTVRRLGQSRRYLLEHFGADRNPDTVTAGDADDWRAWMRGTGPGRKGLAEATTRKTTGDLRDLFRYGRRKKLVGEAVDPFGHLPITSMPNPERAAYVPEADALAVLAELQGRGALSTGELRTLFILARWGGVRIPSEVEGMLWADVDWAAGRLLVRSPKTAGHAGHETREVPLFPELLEALRETFEAAPAGAVHVVPYAATRTGQAFRKPVLAAIDRAGLKPWPRLFHALRASRQTDLNDRYAGHVVAAWLGNSEKVADAHYNRITADHWARAVAEPGADVGGAAGAEAGVVRPVVRAPRARGGTGNEKPPVRGTGGHRGAVRTGPLPPRGVEPLFSP